MKKLSFLLIILFGCTSSQKEELLDKSMKIHEEALKISTQVKEKINQIESASESQTDSLAIVALKDSVEVLSAGWDEWESTLVEVPGREHDHHHHDHDHDHEGHDHSPAPDLTPEMIFEIQEDLKMRIIALDTRAQNIIDSLSGQ